MEIPFIWISKSTSGYANYRSVGQRAKLSQVLQNCKPTCPDNGIAEMSNDEDVFGNEEDDNISLQIKEFGCHLEWKELQKIDGLTLKTNQGVLAGETWDYEERPTYFTAVRNLQGFIEYKLGEEENAEDFFRKVLEKDPVNINALANMVYMLNGQHRVREKHEFERKLRAIFLQCGENTGCCRGYPQRARAYADRAHAIRYFEQDKRCFRYMTYVERAATLGKYCYQTPEKAEWFFDHALALYRRDVQMLYLRKVMGPKEISSVMQRKIESGFEKAVRLFYDVIRLSSSTAYLSLSWVFIGILLNHDPENRTLARVFPNNPVLRQMNADDCYQKGLSIDDTHEITTRRVGAEYVKLKRYSEAKHLLDRSLIKLKSWFGHRYRGVLSLSMYEDEKLTDQDLLSQFRISSRTELLHMAKEDFERAQQERKVHADFSDLGRVHYLLGEKRQAVTKFKKACDSDQDDYFDVLETYHRWAQCLGEDQKEELDKLQRIEKEHRQRLIETPLDTNGDSFSDDFEHYSRNAIHGHVRLLTAADFWVASATGHTRHNPMPYRGPIPPGQLKYDFFLSFHERDRIWCLALLSKLETEYKLRGCIDQRDFEVGADETENIRKFLRDSHRCIIVLSPHYVQDEKSRAVLREAFRVGFKRDGPYVLPLVLTDCEKDKLDPRLQEVQSISCNFGQIPNHHWVNLISSLRQGNDLKVDKSTILVLITLLAFMWSEIPLD